MNITVYSEIESFIEDSFKKRNILPIFGSGFSCGSNAKNGIVPNGAEYSSYMLKKLGECNDIPKDFLANLEKAEFRKIADYYENDKYVSKYTREEYYRNNFTDVVLSTERKSLLEIDWPYVYTLNIDDAIEKNSDFTEVVSANNTVNDSIYNQGNCVIKLHGDVHEWLKYYNRDSRIFTSKEYVNSLRLNTSLLDKLEHDYNFLNILFLGCSLKDELDLISLQPYGWDDKRCVTKKIVFLRKEPDFEQKNNLEQYGITDVVLVDDYSEIYRRIHSTWKKSKLTRLEEMETFFNIKTKRLSSNEKNDSYFLFGKSLYDIKNNLITLPYYFIHRKQTDDVLGLTVKKSIILLQATSVSGKSYCLVDLYLTVTGKNVYYFDGRIRLNNDAFDKLLKQENSLFLFDIGSLSREQFKEILLQSKFIAERLSCAVIMISASNSDFFGIVKLELKNKEINDDHIEVKNFSKYFTSEETEELNKKLPVIEIPTFRDKTTILDNIVYIQKDLMGKGKFSQYNLKISGVNDLILYILMATKEKLYSYEVMKFHVFNEMVNFCNRYREFVEEVSCDLFETYPSDNSPEKFVLNAKFWLHNELGRFAVDENNAELIAEAYLEIIRVIKNSTRLATNRDREQYREFTMFDTINNIFSVTQRLNLKFIVTLYEKLNGELATDYQFLHQFAKGYLMYSYKLDKIRIKEKIEALDLAYKKIIIAESIVKNEMDKKLQMNKDVVRNQTTLAHMDFTKALISCERCISDGFYNLGLIDSAIQELYEAALSPYNDDKIQYTYYSENNRTLNSFTNKCVELSLTKEQTDKINKIRSVIYGRYDEII